MTKKEPLTVPASRDGHEYHEAWAARTALALLVPNTDLLMISMEGFPKEENVGEDASEIADLVRYYGDQGADHYKKIDVVQFKYSPTRPDDFLVASDLSKTLQKFVQTQIDLEKNTL